MVEVNKWRWVFEDYDPGLFLDWDLCFLIFQGLKKMDTHTIELFQLPFFHSHDGIYPSTIR